MLQTEIKASIKEAMLAKDKVRLEVLRSIVAAFTNDLVAKGRKPDESLTDEEVIAIITRLSKQRKDSIDQFTKGGRPELAEKEQAELAVLLKYLPEMMSKDEVLKIAQAKKVELGIEDATKKGMLMSALMKDLKGKADGMVVKEAVDELF